MSWKVSKYFQKKKGKSPTDSPKVDKTQFSRPANVDLQSRVSAEPSASGQTPVSGASSSLLNTSGGVTGGGGGGMSLFQGLNVSTASPQVKQQEAADGSTDTSKGTNAFTESSNFSFISGGTEVEESEKTTETDGLSQGTNSRPVAIDTETHELEESSGEGGFSFLNAPCPRDEPTLSKEAPPPPKVNQTLPTAHVRTLPASEPPLPPDVVQQPRISPASVVGGGAKKPQHKKKKATRPGMVAESSALASEERTGDSVDVLHSPQEVELPTGVDRPEPVSTGYANDDLQHKSLSSLVAAQGKTDMGSSLVSGGAGLMKPGSDTPTLPSRAQKGILSASEEEEGEPSTPDVVNATTSKGDTPASKMQTPTTKKKDPPSSKNDTPIPKQDNATPKENPPTPEENPPTPKEDPPTPKEDPPTPEEDPPTPEEDPPPPAKTQDLLESWKERIEALQRGWQSGLTAIRSKMAATRADCEARFDALLRKAQQRIKWHSHLATLCRQEEEALSEENYSWAEQLKEEIEQLGKDLEADRPVARELLELLPVVMKIFEEVFKEEVSLRTKAVHDVEMHREELSVAVNESTGQFERELTRQEAEVEALSDDVDQRNTSVAKQQEELSIKEEELYQQMSEKCAEFEGRKTALLEEMTTVEDEIEVLEKRLQVLRARRSELVDGIADQDREIALARGSFEEEEVAMRGVKDDLAKQQEELKQRQAVQQEKLQEISSLKDTHSLRRKQFEEVLESLATEMANHQGRLDEVATETKNMKQLEGNFLPDFSPSSELLSLQEEEKAKCELMQKLAEEVVSIQAELLDLRGQLSELRSTIPRLEDGKKAAVTARNYKEAGRLNEELKAKVAREKELAVEVDSLLKRSENTSLRLDDVKQQLSATREEVTRREKEEEEDHLQKLSECCKRVEELKAGCNGGESPFSDLLSHSVNILSCIKEEKTSRTLQGTGGN